MAAEPAGVCRSGSHEVAITDRAIDQAFSDLKKTCAGVRNDYYGLLYLEQEFELERDRAIAQVAFGGNDYGIDGFHFDHGVNRPCHHDTTIATRVIRCQHRQRSGVSAGFGKRIHEQFGVPCDAASVLSILIGLGVIFGVVIVLWYFFGRKDPMKKLQETMRVEFAQYWSIRLRCGGNELVRDKIFI